MARKPNPVKSVQITVSTTPLVHGYLSALVDTGLYGKNAAEAAERLIAKGVEVALAGGIQTVSEWIGKRPADVPTAAAQKEKFEAKEVLREAERKDAIKVLKTE